MNKSFYKKFLIAIIFIFLLISVVLVFEKINRNNHSDKVSIVKNIIKEKYDEVVYLGNTNYIFSYVKKDKYEYSVFDLNGNKLYSFKSDNVLNIVSVNKKYFITKDDKYHLYDTSFKEMTDGDNIYSISDYLIYVDKNVVDETNQILFSDVKNIDKYYDNEYFLIDNLFINKKGKVLLHDYEIEKEYVRNNKIDFFIIKKDKYYCFFPLVDKIIGDGFDKYFDYEKDVYVVSNNKLFKIYTSGLRKEIDYKIDKSLTKKYNIDLRNTVGINKVLVVKDNYLGVFDTINKKFIRIIKTNKFKYKIIDKDYINILGDNTNYIYDLNNNKIIYSNKKIDDIIIFENNYKTIFSSNKYYLYDDNDKLVYESDKQIILLDSKVIIGNINKDIILYKDNKTYNGRHIIINNKDYYKYKNNIISKDLKNKYKSDSFIGYIDETIITLNNKKLIFKNIENNNEYSYYIDDNKIVNDVISKKEIILSNDKNITILNKKGESLKEIKNRKLENVYYNKNLGKIILIVNKDNKKGLFIAE